MAISSLNTKIYHKISSKPIVTVDQTAPNNSVTKLVVNFDRALCSDAVGTLLADSADVKALFAYDGTAGNYTSATYDFETRSVTFVFSAAENTKKLTVVNNSLYDVMGNEYGVDGVDYYLYTAANTPKWAKSNTTDIAYVEIEDLYEVPDVGGKPEKIDTTTLSSTVKTSMLGIKDPGDLVFKFNFENGSASENFRVLKTYETNQTLVWFKVVYQDNTWVEFSAYVSVSVDSAKVNDCIHMSVTLMIASMFYTTNI